MPKGKPIPPDVRKKYVALRDEGYTRAEAARRVKVSYDWATQYDKGLKARGNSKPSRPGANVHPEYEKVRGAAEEFPAPKHYDELSPEAQRAHDDIGYFAERYFGVRLLPFQVYGTRVLMDLAATEDEEYVVINQPPGSGKSAFYTLILPSWLTVRNRATRGMIGSATDALAKIYVGNLREQLTNPYPVTADPPAKRAGIAQDAVATLVGDFGRFKPEVAGRKFANDGFFVELPEGEASAQKEPTWSAYGMDSGYIGIRVGVALWDDSWDPAKNRSAESRESFVTRWKDVSEKRLEPGGLLALIMQRLDPDDIAHACLEMEGTIIRPGDEIPRKYHHIKFKAHYDELCMDDHGPDAQPYFPDSPSEGGCLLYPKRLSWKKLEAEQRNNPNFEMVFNQEDVAAAAALVDRLWIDGGTDPRTKEVYPGCVDKERDLCEIPKNLAGKLLSVVTADPSPTQYWAIQWWGVRCAPDPQERYLLDLHREKMGANDLLDWNNETQEFTGLLHDWWLRSKDLGAKITHLIMEDNAAQRFMFQYDVVKRWVRHTGVQIIRHNCVDPETEVLSRFGWRNMDTLSVGDEILTLNMMNGLSEWKPVDYIYRGEYEGPMARFSSRALDALTTPDHRWPVSNQERKPLEFRTSDSLGTGSVIPLARPLSPEHDPESCYSDDLVELIGWAVTEGSFGKRERGVKISQCPKAHPEFTQRIRLLLKGLRADWKEWTNRTTGVITFGITGPVAHAVRAVTGGSKHLPSEFLAGLPSRQRDLLLETLIDGDGWRSGPRGRSYCSNDLPLIGAVEYLAALQGYPTTRSQRQLRPKRDGSEGSLHHTVTIKTWADAYMQSPSNRPIMEGYSGMIWCPSTVNGTFYARRGGVTYFTGNTNRNKADPTLGVQSIASQYRYGRVRLPYRADTGARLRSQKLIDELIRWPRGRTDDCVMANWFLEWNLPNLKPRERKPIVLRRPSWMAA